MCRNKEKSHNTHQFSPHFIGQSKSCPNSTWRRFLMYPEMCHEYLWRNIKVTTLWEAALWAPSFSSEAAVNRMQPKLWSSQGHISAHFWLYHKDRSWYWRQCWIIRVSLRGILLQWLITFFFAVVGFEFGPSVFWEDAFPLKPCPRSFSFSYFSKSI
jgi:hypothetical protein